jgi:hypothetical protein
MEVLVSKGTFKFLTGKPAGKKPLARSRRKWEEYVRMDHKEMRVNTNTRIWLISVKLRITGDHLRMRHWTSGLHKYKAS